MQKLIIRLLFILAGMAFANVYGQNITFNHLTTDNGLSQFSVNSLYIDESGILWIGTREGLNRSLPAVAIDEAILKLNDFDAEIGRAHV